MTNRWEDIILTLSIMKPEAVDKERINMMLLMDETVDLQTIDNLQSLGVLTTEQYQHHLHNLKKRQVAFDLPAQVDMRLKDIEKNPDNFCASKYYVCGFNSAYFGAGIANQMQEFIDCKPDV